MSFVYGTNCELLFSMPAIGASITGTGKSIITGTSATSTPFQMPALQSIWSPSQMPGKAIHIEAAGGYDIASGTNTMQLSLDSAVNTQSFILAATGAVTWPVSSTGFWQLEFDLTCTAAGLTTSTWYSAGNLVIGAGNAPTTFGSAVTFSNTVTAGIPQPNTIPNNISYYPEIYVTWSAGPTACVCTQFQVWALN